MTTTAEPVRWDRTIYRGTDHAWTARRVDSLGEPLIPTSAKAQVRSSYGGALWVECGIAIDALTGWITISIPEEATASDAWASRTSGVWDLEVVLNGQRLRWAEGRVSVSQDVTREVVV